jgi:hypothetical protein
MNSVGGVVTSSAARPMMASGESILCDLRDGELCSENGGLRDAKSLT